jgi:hypothetical protein
MPRMAARKRTDRCAAAGTTWFQGGNQMSPQHTFTRIPLQVGSELRIRKNGEVSVSNPTIEGAPAQDAADAVLDYRFDPQTGEHVIRLLEPVAYQPGRRERR